MLPIIGHGNGPGGIDGDLDIDQVLICLRIKNRKVMVMMMRKRRLVSSKNWDMNFVNPI